MVDVGSEDSDSDDDWEDATTVHLKRPLSNQQAPAGDKMRNDGWTEASDGKWKKDVLQAEGMIEPKGVRNRRRVTRDVGTGVCIDDLRVTDATAPGILKRTLKRPRNMQVTVEVFECEPGQPWDEDGVVKEEASKYRAATARFNVLARIGRTFNIARKNVRDAWQHH